ncbi:MULTISPECIES: MlaD family protein [Nocardia]|uniref:MlaD family protein n=1 Tax=Nocardia TaxID=1817 RepID=UPI000FD7E54B|nr:MULTISPECIES: MlaD family protein [Nocardia]MBF6183982.1 MCE family protein [Nocardia farcinica]MBF6292925.1 MCE family protein [Nocardia farcinica]MBF6309825.1 MCE family protein [Nocardia farcinica]MBF6379220.1 MCE family protein [Nocardia farcinica]MBF6383934.1 MCE family protein [Nocardia farcinica]
MRAHRTRALPALLVLAAVAALVTAVAAVRLERTPTRALCALFDTTFGLYADAPVTVRGVTVGRVHAIVPEGGHVRVEMTVERRRLSEHTVATVVNASLLTDRRVELVDSDGPGAELPAEGCLPTDRTRTPVGVAEALGSFSRIAEDLTRPAADGTTPLSALLAGADRELSGLGPELDQQLRSLSHLLAAPEVFGAELGALLDNSAELSRFVTAEWADIKTSMITFGPGLELLERTLVIVKILVGKLAAALGPLDRAFNHHFPYLMDALEQSVPLVTLARTEAESAQDLLATIPGVITMLQRMIDGGGGLAVEYRPPALCPAPDPALCDAVGAQAARVPVPLAVLAGVGGAR